MASIKLLDPTQAQFAGNTDYQNLFIFVDMTASRKGSTVLNRDDESSSREFTEVNLMGYNQSRIREKRIFTTDYTKIDNDDTVYEGFGIKSINIETNPSYVPKIIIEFVDVKGIAFFNKAKSSPYSVIFDFPPPIFNLKIKGYYGKTLEYKLHLVRHNTRFEADTGNFYITAEFVGNTFAPLTDILFQNVLMVPKLLNNGVNFDPTGPVTSLAGLVAKSKIINNKIIQSTLDTEEYKEVNEDSLKAQEYAESFSRLLELPNDITIIKIFKPKLPNIVNPEDIEFTSIRNQVKLSELINTNQFEYYIISNVISTNRTIRNVYDNLFSTFKTENSKISENKNQIEIIYQNSRYYLSANNFSLGNINYLNINKDIDYANNIKNNIDLSLKRGVKTLDDKVKNIITEELGFLPTIENIIKVIANDIDSWVNLLSDTYNQSIGYINDKNTLFQSIYPGVDKIYPFPDFIERGVKSLPNSGDLLNMPEIKFTDNFIQNFVDYKNFVANQQIDTESELSGENNKNVWFPINPNDSSYVISSSFKFPYRNVTTVDGILNELFARFYIYLYYTNNNSINENSEDRANLIKKNLDYFFKNEKNVINSLIKDEKLLRAFKGYLDNISTLLNNESFLRDFKFDPINVSDSIDSILAPLYIDKINFTGIKFLNRLNEILLEIPEFLKYKRYYNGEDVRQLNLNDFGFTLNKSNNIIYYDGNNNDITSFVSVEQSKTNTLNEVIKKSLNFGMKGYSPLNNQNPNQNRFIKRSDNIYLYPDINDKIYDYYLNYNNPDNYKKSYGILNIMYIPSDKIKILLDTTAIVELPVLIKLYLSSLVYAIETEGVLIPDINYFNNNPYLTVFNEAENKDYINVLYSNNFISTNSIKNKILDTRNYIVEKLKNLSEEDKKTFIDFYKNYVDKNFDVLDNFIKSLLNSESGKFNNIYNNINTDNITSLFTKTIIVNNSDFTYKSKNDFQNLFVRQTVSNNIKNLLKNNDIVQTSFRNLFSELKISLNNSISQVNTTNQETVGNIQQVRIETYYSFKNFVDRWFVTDTDEQISAKTLFFSGIGENEINPGERTLFNLFSFVDRASNPLVAKNAIIDFTILQEFENDYNVNMLTVIAKLLNENGFEFYPLQNFITYNDSTWNINEVFTPQTTSIDVSKFGPRFTCMYVGGTSKYLDSGYNSNTTFKNDGIMDVSETKDFSEEGSESYGFRVRFGDGKQSLFINIDLNTEEFQPTNESLKSMSLILDGNDKNVIPIAQNLFTTYEQRSYTCKVKMMGNSMIQPTQYFMLENIPMFSGLYLILKITHSIDGETNSMYTEFEGVRLPKEPRPFILSPFDVYVKRFLNKDLIIPDEITIAVQEDLVNAPQLNRTIHLVAGHNTTDQGASANIEGQFITEYQLTTELRNLIKFELDKISIKNTTDSDTDNINSVVNKLNQIVKPSDLVVDIHFNASTNPTATGVEVLIKDPENTNLVEISKSIARSIGQTLNLTLRRSEDVRLPVGVKLQSESQYRSLAIFNVNCDVILIEVGFITNKSDYISYQENKIELAKNIARIISEVSVSESDELFSLTETYSSLNILRYDNINTRLNPYTIESSQISLFNSLIPTNNFTFRQTSDNASFLNKFNNGTLYKADKLIINYPNFNDYKEDIKTQIELTSSKFKIDWLFLSSLISIESKFNPVAISKTGAFGIGQFVLSSGLLEILRILNDNKGFISNVIIYDKNSNTYIEKTLNYGEILSFLFDNKPIDVNRLNSDNITSTLKNEKLLYVLINNIFNNPFLSIELIGIYLNKLQSYVGTLQNKNLGILSFSYNTGNHKVSNSKSINFYTEHLYSYYSSPKTTQLIKDKIIGKIPNEGIKYPERLINEYIIKFIPTLDLTKSTLV